MKRLSLVHKTSKTTYPLGYWKKYTISTANPRRLTADNLSEAKRQIISEIN